MEITTSITVPDYVYFFYRKLANQMDNATAEQVMAQALLVYAGSAAAEVIKNHTECTKA